MVKPCPKCGSRNVAQRITWCKVTGDMLMRVECNACNLQGPEYTFGRQGKQYSDADFNRAERLSVQHWNAEAHRESEES